MQHAGRQYCWQPLLQCEPLVCACLSASRLALRLVVRVACDRPSEVVLWLVSAFANKAVNQLWSIARPHGAVCLAVKD
jgi:hypothetical protein